MYRIVKRAFDVAFSLLAVVLTSPAWLLIALGIKASSPGPVFYRSLRAGRDHREFPVYKFRSMHLYRPADPSDGRVSEGGFIANQQRIFPLGSFLRKSKLDELPQLLSVLTGEMSLVGPRPYPEKAVQKFYTGDYACVMTVRPGLTGLDSLFDYAHGELFVKDNDAYTKTVLPIRTELARLYVERQSLALDLHCVLRTFRLVFEIVALKRKEFPLTKYEAEAARRAAARRADGPKAG